MNIVLIGPRGSGKTAVGEALGEMLGIKVVGLDERIIQKAGCSVTEIVNRSGWAHFRALESAVVREVSELDGMIIDTGGGVVTDPRNVELLKQNGVSFWLTASISTLVNRVERGTDRPSLLQGKSLSEEMEAVLAQRLSLYRGMADCTIDTTNLSVAQAAGQIREYLETNRIPPFDKILTKV